MERVQVNPIIPGFAPDPSTICVDRTFFLVNSTFHMFPGLPIYVSKDLCTWTHIGNAINRRSQLDLGHSLTKLHTWPSGESMLAQGGLYAPTIRYHKGTFYIVCTNVLHKSEKTFDQNEFSNFIISTTDIWSNEWSEPVFYNFNGIDTSLFWDDDDRCYLVGSASPAPATKIRQFEIDVNTGEKLSEEVLLWEGITKVFPEGPHVYKKDGWYYLLVAEGGCFEEHHSIMARSRNVMGPYEENPQNPVMPKAGSDRYINFTGHGDLVQDPTSGQWYFICLGARKTPDNRFLMGRETFITTAQWPENEFPTIDLAELDVPILGGRKPVPKWPVVSPNSSFTPRKEFLHIRNPHARHFEYLSEGITLHPSKDDLDQNLEPIAFVGMRQRSLEGTASVVVKVPSADSAKSFKAGLCYYKDEHRYARVALNFADQKIEWEFKNAARKISRETKASIGEYMSPGADPEFVFGISYTEEKLVFWYAPREGDKISKRFEFESIDTLEMTNYDFIGPVIGVFAVGVEDASVQFSEFRVD